MKFAVACLIGAVSAYGEFWEWKDIGDMKGQMDDIKGLYMDNIDMIEEHDRKEHRRLAKEFGPYGKHFEEMGEAFGPEFMAWLDSPAVHKKQRFEQNVIWPSDEMQDLVKAGMDVGDDVMHADWAMGFTNKGYFEQVSNHDLKELFEDLYEIKESLKRLSESDMVRKNNKLGMETLKDQHFQNMAAMWEDRKECEFMKKLCKKVCETLKRWKREAKACPLHQQMKRKIIKLLKTAIKTVHYYDLPA